MNTVFVRCVVERPWNTVSATLCWQFVVQTQCWGFCGRTYFGQAQFEPKHGLQTGTRALSALLRAEYLPVADFNTKVFTTAVTCHDSCAIAGVGFVSSCAATLWAAQRCWTGDTSHVP